MVVLFCVSFYTDYVYAKWGIYNYIVGEEWIILI